MAKMQSLLAKQVAANQTEKLLSEFVSAGTEESIAAAADVRSFGGPGAGAFLLPQPFDSKAKALPDEHFKVILRDRLLLPVCLRGPFASTGKQTERFVGLCWMLEASTPSSARRKALTSRGMTICATGRRMLGKSVLACLPAMSSTYLAGTSLASIPKLNSLTLKKPGLMWPALIRPWGRCHLHGHCGVLLPHD